MSGAYSHSIIFRHRTRTSLVLIIFLSFVFSFSSFAQDSLRREIKDSSLSFIRLHTQETLIRQSLEYSLLTAEPTEIFTKYFGSTAMPGTPQFDWTLGKEVDLIAPWKLHLAEQEKYQPVKIDLTGAMTGGALYIAYKHLKKYGLK